MFGRFQFVTWYCVNINDDMNRSLPIDAGVDTVQFAEL